MNISIALATFNGSKYLAAQLKSLMGQERPPGEIVFVDDGSSDGTLEIIERFRSSSRIPTKFAITEYNHHCTGAFLKAVGMCTGEYVAFCDQDDIWCADKLRKCAEALSREPVDLLVHSGRLIDAYGKVLPGTCPDFSQLETLAGRAPFRLAWGYAMVFRRKLAEELLRVWDWDRYRCFRERYGPMLGHDQLLYAWAYGRSAMHFLDEPLVDHRLHDQNLAVKQSVDKNRLDRLAHYLKQLQFVPHAYQENASKWAAEAEFLDELMNRLGGIEVPGVRTFSLQRAQRAKAWQHRANIYDRKSFSRSRRLREVKLLLSSRSYFNGEVSESGLMAILKDVVVAAIL